MIRFKRVAWIVFSLLVFGAWGARFSFSSNAVPSVITGGVVAPDPRWADFSADVRAAAARVEAASNDAGNTTA